MRKQLDPRIPILINNNVKQNHRSFIVLVGDKGRDQVGIPLFLKYIHLLKQLGMIIVDRQSPFPPLTGSRVRQAICAMVLQEGTRVY